MWPSSALPSTRLAFGHRLMTLAARLVELSIRPHPIGPAFLDQADERRVLRGEDGSDLDMAHSLAGAFEQVCWIGCSDAQEESQTDVAILRRNVEDTVGSRTVWTVSQRPMIESLDRPRDGVACNSADLGKYRSDGVRRGGKEFINGLVHVRNLRCLI